MNTQAEHKVKLGDRYFTINLNNQKPSSEYPLVIPELVLQYCTKHEDRPFIGIYTKYNHRAKFVVENLVPVLKAHGMSKVSQYLDIGCGTGAIPALLAQRLKAEQVYLIDGDGTAQRMTSFTPRSSPWSDVQVAMSMVSANVEKNVIVAGILANQPSYDLIPKELGLVTSFRSWGHHYWVDTYISMVKRHLMHGGLVMLDIRNGTNGFDEMKLHGFKYLVDVPDTSKKCRRALFTNA